MKPLKFDMDSRQSWRWSIYPHTQFMYAWATKPDKGVVGMASDRFITCRETLIGALFDKNTIPKTKIRILVRNISRSAGNRFGKEFDKRTAKGLRILNMMEERHSWPLTKMLDVEPLVLPKEYTYGNRRNNLVLYSKCFSGSRRWMRSPHMVSLFTLLIRLPSKGKRFSGVKTYEDIERIVEGLAPGSRGDAYHVRTTFRYWDELMSNYDKLFTNMPIKYLFDKESYRVRDNIYRWAVEGITGLCKSDSGNKKLQSRFKNIMMQAGLD